MFFQALQENPFQHPCLLHATPLLFSRLACVQTALHADLTLHSTAHRGVTRLNLPVLVSSRYPAVCTPVGTEQNHFHSCCSLNVIKHLCGTDTNTKWRQRSAVQPAALQKHALFGENLMFFLINLVFFLQVFWHCCMPLNIMHMV